MSTQKNTKKSGGKPINGRANKLTEADKMFHLTGKFAMLNKLIMRDLNSNTAAPTFSLYTKDDINAYLQNPYRYEKQLREAAIYIYGASSHFRRLVQYFVGLSDLSYIVSPHNIDPSTVDPESIRANYHTTLGVMSALNVKTQFPKVLTVCMREDTFYGTMWVTDDNIIIQHLPAEYSRITTIEDGVPNVTFNFSYFDSRKNELPYFPPEFTSKYNVYFANKTTAKWQELDSPTSFAIKCNNDILDYSLPPFAGVLREVYELEDYKQLKLTKTTLENYAMLVMKLGMNSDGEWEMPLEQARTFFNNMASVLPEEIGAVLSPMPVDKVGFERSHTGNTDTIAEAEQNMFTAAGVSSLLFNNPSASAGALTLSIKADQSITFGLVKSIEDAINRYLRAQTYGQNFKVTFLDCSPFNRAEVGDMYLKACQYGVPMVSYYCASQGLGQAEMECMNFLENDLLDIKSKFVPLQSSSTQSSDSDDEGGAPEKSLGELSDSGEQSREDGDDW